ncbi:hypothetical protein [Fangia hongkongensis]|uniref:hypothetical protein n=1 Tax=Fangia hongkongensis TaxID=270495 RepID=UPI0012B6152D|nr:hypothetical protein [Fangia hongkongensis]MBK2125538.1 hypothetical protein [Fangia hongkongensis]
MSGVKELMSIIDKLELEDYQKDYLLSKLIKKQIFPKNGMSDGPCLAASFIACMGFLNKGLSSIPQPGHIRFKDFGTPFYADYGSQIRDPKNTLIAEANQSIKEYKEKLSSRIKDTISSEEGAVILNLESESHYISAFKYNGRVWYIDALQGYGFNLYENALNNSSRQPTDDEYMKQYFSVDIINVSNDTFNSAKSSVWWKQGIRELSYLSSTQLKIDIDEHLAWAKQIDKFHHLNRQDTPKHVNSKSKPEIFAFMGQYIENGDFQDDYRLRFFD